MGCGMPRVRSFAREMSETVTLGDCLDRIFALAEIPYYTPGGRDSLVRLDRIDGSMAQMWSTVKQGGTGSRIEVAEGWAYDCNRK